MPGGRREERSRDIVGSGSSDRSVRRSRRWRRGSRRVALVIPPDPPLVSCNRDAMGGFGILTEKRLEAVYPPLDVVFAATVLRSLGVEVVLVDSLGKDLPPERVASLAADTVAVRIAYPTLTTDLEWTSRLKRLRPDTAVAVFGPTVDHLREDLHRGQGLDLIVSGEAEAALPTLLLDPQPPPKEGAKTEDLDRLPFPDWSLLDVSCYTLGETPPAPGPAFPVSASRGCPHGCRYCPYPVSQGTALRARSPRNVLDELGYLIERWQAKHVLFRDPCFGMRKEWLVALCDGIRSRRLNLTWRCETRGELLGHGVLEAMAEAGLVAVNLGVESADPRVLEKVGRQPRIHEAADAIRACRSLGLEAHVFLMAGLPGETAKSFERTVDWVMDLHPASVQILPLVLYPGTELHRSAVRDGHARWTKGDPRLRGKVLAPSWWDAEQARAVEEARVRIALAHADWLRSLETTGSPAAPVSVPTERLRSYLQAARIVVRRGEPAAALEWLDAAAGVDPDHESVLVERGKVRAAAGDKAGAEREFRRALAATPGSRRASLHLAAILTTQKRWDEAIPLLEQLLARDDLLPARRSSVHRVLSMAYTQQGQPDRALSHRREWLRMMADSGHPWQMDE